MIKSIQIIYNVYQIIVTKNSWKKINADVKDSWPTVYRTQDKIIMHINNDKIEVYHD